MSWGISTALYHRERTGQGQKLDISLLQAAVLQNNQMNHIDADNGWRNDYVVYLKTAFSEGKSRDEILDHHEAVTPQALARAYYGLFRTQDGMIGIGGLSKVFQRSLVRLLELDDPSITDPDWHSDDMKAHMRAMRETVESKLQQQPTAHWLEAIGALGVPVAEYHTPEQMPDSEQAWKNDYLVRLEHETLGGMTVVGPPVKFSETPLEVGDASPVLGKHSRELLTQTGMAAEAIDRLIEFGAVISSS
jgi:CoA:oxalate CoA-transferase